MNKFASNVTERAIIYSQIDYKATVFQVLCRTMPNTNEVGLIKLTKDAFGNYVVQRLYEHADIPTKIALYKRIKEDPEAVAELSKNNYGKHVLTFLDKNKVELR